MTGPLSSDLSQDIKDLLAFVLPLFEVGAINDSCKLTLGGRSRVHRQHTGSTGTVDGDFMMNV